MNERIRELAEQATKHYPATETSGEFSTFDKEKFAQLIAAECAGIYDRIENGNQHLGTDDYLEALHKTFFWS